MDRFMFRAWHTELDVMLKPGDSYGTRDSKDPYRYWADGQPVKLMQCTGLCDKNGVLIYEGDIVHLDAYGDYIVRWNEVDYIGFETELIGDVQELYMIDNDFDIATSKYYQIIGNIYQNKELLNEPS